MWVVEGLVTGVVAGSLGLSESFGKTSHIVFHSFGIPSKGGGEGGCQDWRCVLDEVTEVYVIDIFVGIDFEDLFNNFCDCGRFL